MCGGDRRDRARERDISFFVVGIDRSRLLPLWFCILRRCLLALGLCNEAKCKRLCVLIYDLLGPCLHCIGVRESKRRMTRGPQAYGEPSYWDDRYRQDCGSFDWYQQYSGLAPLLHKYVQKTSRILMVGCGNAVLSEDMVNDGYQEIMNIDISSVVIEAMQRKYKDYPQLKYVTMDVRDMSSFADQEFDFVIDKGMLDSLMCGSSAHLSAAKMLEEVRRVLKPGGTYMLITYGDPCARMQHLKAPESNCWSVLLHVLPKVGSQRASEKWNWEVTTPVPLKEDESFNSALLADNLDLHYVYICTKAQESMKVGLKGPKHGKAK